MLRSCFCFIVLVPQKFAQQARLEGTRSTIASMARMAASVVDGDLHRRLIQHYSPELYDVVEPLVRLHSANPDIFYLYMLRRDKEEQFLRKLVRGIVRTGFK